MRFSMMLCALLLVPVQITAQGVAQGIAKRPISSPEEFAVACETGDPQDLLNVECSEIVAWLNQYRPGLGITEVNFPGYLRRLNMVDCPVGNFAVNREIGGRILREENPSARFVRTLVLGDKCLADNNSGEVMFIMSCGNSPYDMLPAYAGAPRGVTSAGMVFAQTQALPDTVFVQLVGPLEIEGLAEALRASASATALSTGAGTGTSGTQTVVTQSSWMERNDRKLFWGALTATVTGFVVCNNTTWCGGIRNIYHK